MNIATILQTLYHARTALEQFDSVQPDLALVAAAESLDAAIAALEDSE